MPAATYDIIVEQGGTYEIEYTLQRETAGGNAPYDLTGADIYATVRAKYGAPASEEFIVSIMDRVNGVFRLKLTSSQTDRLTVGNNVYDVELHITADNGELQVVRLLEGVATVTPSVTTQR